MSNGEGREGKILVLGGVFVQHPLTQNRAECADVALLLSRARVCDYRRQVCCECPTETIKIKARQKRKKEKRKQDKNNTNQDTLKRTRNILFSSDVVECDYVEVRTVTREVSFQGLDFVGCLSQ